MAEVEDAAAESLWWIVPVIPVSVQAPSISRLPHKPGPSRSNSLTTHQTARCPQSPSNNFGARAMATVDLCGRQVQVTEELPYLVDRHLAGIEQDRGDGVTEQMGGGLAG